VSRPIENASAKRSDAPKRASSRQPPMIGKIFFLTGAGRKALETQDAAVPSDFRFILWLIDFHGQERLERLDRLFPEQRIAECLEEMEELRLIEHVPLGQDVSAGSEARRAPVISLSEDELRTASSSLLRHGAYLAEARLKGRAAIAKSPSEIAILIVEDDPDQLALADLRVSMAGYAVRVADSRAALLKNLAEKGKPDLLLLDVVLPDGDGFEILSKLRKHRSFSELPVVMLTAKSDAADIVMGLSLGADGYVTKPYTKNLLVKVVQQVLGQSA
jgi:CheY-like chemotaxis protein